MFPIFRPALKNCLFKRSLFTVCYVFWCWCLLVLVMIGLMDVWMHFLLHSPTDQLLRNESSRSFMNFSVLMEASLYMLHHLVIMINH